MDLYNSDAFLVCRGARLANPGRFAIAALYDAEPFADPRLTPELQKRVLGAMAEQWSEQVDASSIESRMWPRALAVAERLWSPRSQVWVENVTVSRLEKASCQVLERRGVRGGPVASGFCPWSLHWDS